MGGRRLWPWSADSPGRGKGVRRVGDRHGSFYDPGSDENRQKLSARFEVGDVFKIPMQSADVVSASSLLATLDDKVGGFQALLAAVKPGGSLLIIEPTDRMSVPVVDALIRDGLPNGRIAGLRMWARARQGHAIDPEIFKVADAGEVTFTPLLGGLVGAWLFERDR